MPKSWHSLPFILLASLVSVLAASQSFENEAIVRSVELGGSIVHVTTTYAVKALDGGSKTYTIALGHDEKEHSSWLEAKIKGSAVPLPLKERTNQPNSKYVLFDVTLPKALPAGQSINLVLEAIQSHVTHPYPETAGQNDDQALKYTTNLFVLSPYATTVQRTKIKARNPQIISFTTPERVGNFVADGEAASKSGATVTYGPFNDIPPSTSSTFLGKYQQPVTVHYGHDQPVLEILSLNRAVEISHWGANLNTQDDMILHNAGPKLKRHFSRLDHQTQAFYKRQAPHVLPALTLHLPAGVRNTYYYDLIGNVSTSRLRVAPSVPKNKQGTSFSVLEMKPRYPLLGGWNYTFTLGWDSPLADLASYDKSTGRYYVEVPIMTPILGAVVNTEELKIVLPEGATDVEFSTPFPPVSSTLGTHTTYLDTVGRPTITLNFKDLTVRHADNVYVSYKLSTMAHLQKPLAVATAFLGLFALGFIARRVDLTLHQKSKKN